MSRDITLQEFVLQARGYVQLLWSKKIRIIICALIGGGLFYLLATLAGVKYKSELSYMINEDLSSGGGVTSILDQFGFGSGSEYKLDRIIQLAESRRISETALMDSIEIDSQDDLLANHMIDYLTSVNQWKNKANILGVKKKQRVDIDDFRFVTDSIDMNDMKSRVAIRKLHNHIIGTSEIKAMMNPSYDELSGILHLTVSARSEQVALNLNQALFESLSKFYVEKTVEKQQYNYNIIESRYDSLNLALSKTQYASAKLKDNSTSIFRSQDKVRSKQLEIEERKLITILAEAEKQKLILELALEDRTPFIQVIDRPIIPLDIVKKSKSKYFVLGMMIFGIIAILFILSKTIYSSILKDK